MVGGIENESFQRHIYTWLRLLVSRQDMMLLHEDLSQNSSVCDAHVDEKGLMETVPGPCQASRRGIRRLCPQFGHATNNLWDKDSSAISLSGMVRRKHLQDRKQDRKERSKQRATQFPQWVPWTPPCCGNAGTRVENALLGAPRWLSRLSSGFGSGHEIGRAHV